MSNFQEGQRVPELRFRMRQDGAWRERTTADLFAGKTVIVFSLPGAFTPTCSSSHVPRFNELAPTFAALGVSEIVCVSVNDAWVMDAWKQDQRADAVTFLPDAHGALSKALGMLVDKGDLGMRSRRYSMLVRDGVVEKMFVEEDIPGDPFQVSDADSMLSYLGGTAGPDILLITRPGCAHCARAKALLTERGLPWAELPASPRTLRAIPGARTTPQVFANGHHIGGADELAGWLGPATPLDG